MNTTPFWIVVSQARGPAQWPYRHATQTDALNEAVRLCKSTGSEFYVFEAKVSVRKSDIVVKRLADYSDIPF